MAFRSPAQQTLDNDPLALFLATNTRGMCRAKFGEAAFLDVYQKLYEAPDPAPALAYALVITESFQYSFQYCTWPASYHRTQP